MVEIFQGNTANVVWQAAAHHFRTGQGVSSQGSRAGTTKEMLHAVFSIANPRERWVTSRNPAMNVAFAIAEVVWIMAGRNDLAFLQFWNRKYKDHAGCAPELHGAYGHRLRSHQGLDQLVRAYEVLKHNPDSRQVVLQIWDAARDLPSSEGREASADIPCNTLSMLKIRSGKLEWTQIVRSNDLFLGVPHNFVQFTYLQEILAGWLGVGLGTYNHLSDSLHVYDRDLPNIQVIQSKLDSPPPNTDVVSLAKGNSDELFAELTHRAYRLTQGDLLEGEVRRIAEWPEAPSGFQNMLLVLTAEAARRRSLAELGGELMVRCSSPLYRFMWDRWLSRISGVT
jgi:thymidylate synthase